MRRTVLYFLETLSAEGPRLFLFVPVFLAMGIGLYFVLPYEPKTQIHFIPPILIAVAYLMRRIPALWGVNYFLIPFLLISVGFSAAMLRQQWVAAPVLTQKSFSSIEGKIVDLSFGRKETRMVLENVVLEGELYKTVRLNVRTGSDHLTPGDFVKLDAVLLPPPLPTHPGAYDFQRDLYFKSIGAVGYAVNRPSIIKTRGDSDPHPLFSWSSTFLRHAIAQQITQYAPKESQGFLMAVMIGEKRVLDKETEENMRKSGLAHMLAISGLHMVMIGGLVFFFTRFLLSLSAYLTLRYPIKTWSAIAAMIAVSGYLLVSGMSVSAVRAYIMIMLVFGAICFNRQAISLRNVALAAIFILLLRPESLLSASFQMSFAAVFALVAFYEKFSDRFYMTGHKAHFLLRPVIYGWGVAMTSLVATFATALFAIYHFGQFSLAGIFVNSLAVPIMGFWVMPMVILSFALMPFDAAWIGFYLAAMGVDLIEKLAGFGASFDYSSIPVKSFSQISLVLLILSMICLVCFRSRLKLIGVLPLAAAIGAQSLHQLPDILVSDSGRLVLLASQESGPIVNDRRRERFIRSRWQEYYGVREVAIFKEIIADDKGELRCDPLGCVWKTNNTQTIAYSLNPYSHKADCERADVVIAQDPIRIDCSPATLSIDRFDLWRNGAHALYITNERPFRVTTVNGVRGNRPWVPNR
ncbi:ComEC/Rec2 family competence protein [Sneathiella glossodoripedis]|uniref:ComEC/Rec2 family competence protein n=1 Tax=Sneathiella glossodoripedis TaxID=418853 RepID=UPI000470572D|nr:ComEC/Rec2 family competence protein [Sneathiella glossodoripedis]